MIIIFIECVNSMLRNVCMFTCILYEMLNYSLDYWCNVACNSRAASYIPCHTLTQKVIVYLRDHISYANYIPVYQGGYFAPTHQLLVFISIKITHNLNECSMRGRGIHPLCFPERTHSLLNSKQVYKLNLKCEGCFLQYKWSAYFVIMVSSWRMYLWTIPVCLI